MKKITHPIFLAMLVVSMAGCSSTKNTAANGQRNGGPSTTELLAQMDSNGDGKLSKSEVKGPLSNDFAKIDLDSDGFITAAELDKAPKPNRPSQGQGGQQGPPPGGRN